MPETSPPTIGDGWEERMVELSLIDPSPFQVRSSLQGIEELAESIRLHGLLNPILLRPMNGRFQLVAGARRCKATALLGKTSILARIKEMSDAEALALGLIDNDLRDDTNPIEKARGYRMLLDPPFNTSYEKIEKEFGKSRSRILEILQLLDEPEPIQQWVASGKLTLSHARALRKIAEPNQRVELARQVVEHEWSAAKTEAHIKKQQTEKEHAADNGATAPASAPAENKPKSAEDAAASIMEKLMPKATPASANKPAPSVEGHLEKPVQALKKLVEKTVGFIPARAPFLRLALIGAVLAIGTGYFADNVERPWAGVALRALVGLFWLAVSALVVRYLVLNKERFTTRLTHWLRLMVAIKSGDLDRTRAAARRFQPESKADPSSSRSARLTRRETKSQGPAAPKAEEQPRSTDKSVEKRRPISADPPPEPRA